MKRFRLLAAGTAALSALTVVGLQAQRASASSVVVQAIADTYSNGGAPNTNYGSACCLAIGGKAPYVSFLRFVVPADATAATLTLTVDTQTFAGSTSTFEVKQADDTWGEKTLTKNNQPAISTTVLGTFVGTTPSGTINVALTGVAGLAGQEVTLALTGGTDDLWLWSHEHSAAVAPTLKVTTGAAPPGPVVGVLGDSISHGCCAADGSAVASPYWRVAANELGWSDPVVDGVGGSGYATAGQGVPYTDRIGPFLDANPNLQALIVEGGGNDPPDASVLTPAVNSVFDTIKAKDPNLRVYVLGPYSFDSDGEYPTQRSVIQQSAAAHGFVFIDQIAEGWMRGRPDLLYSDGFHPNEGGHQLLGDRLASDLAVLACHDGCTP